MNDHGAGRIERFIGIDLSWKCSPFLKEGTAICRCDATGRMDGPFLVTDDKEILSFIESSGNSWVAIDASLNVPNEVGMRTAERMVAAEGIPILPTSQTFLRRHCGGSRGEMLVRSLENAGYHLAAPHDLSARSIFETYPYGSLRSMAPGRRIKYKDGPADVRRKALIEVLNIVKGWERSIVMPRTLEEEILEANGKELGQATDKVDAVVCAACVYAHWLYQGRTTRMLGEENDGYILLA